MGNESYEYMENKAIYENLTHFYSILTSKNRKSFKILSKADFLTWMFSFSIFFSPYIFTYLWKWQCASGIKRLFKWEQSLFPCQIVFTVIWRVQRRIHSLSSYIEFLMFVFWFDNGYIAHKFYFSASSFHDDSKWHLTWACSEWKVPFTRKLLNWEYAFLYFILNQEKNDHYGWKIPASFLFDA